MKRLPRKSGHARQGSAVERQDPSPARFAPGSGDLRRMPGGERGATHRRAGERPESRCAGGRPRGDRRAHRGGQRWRGGAGRRGRCAGRRGRDQGEPGRSVEPWAREEPKGGHAGDRGCPRDRVLRRVRRRGRGEGDPRSGARSLCLRAGRPEARVRDPQAERWCHGDHPGRRWHGSRAADRLAADHDTYRLLQGGLLLLDPVLLDLIRLDEPDDRLQFIPGRFVLFDEPPLTAPRCVPSRARTPPPACLGGSALPQTREKTATRSSGAR